MLLYSMLYLTGYGLTLDDLKAFRQWGSRTPGHPEVHHTPGVEVTTGPLGQGFANGVGMGIAERYLRARFGAEVCDHHTFVICSDGDLEEGISHEAASLAGHLGLGRLVYVYDDNHIRSTAPPSWRCSDDAGKRFEAYGWHVDRIGEVANDLDALEAAVRRAMAVEDAPSLIVLRSHIGYPSPEVHRHRDGARQPARRRRDRASPRRSSACRPTRRSGCPTTCSSYYREARPRAARGAREDWEKPARRAGHGDRGRVRGVPRPAAASTGWEAKLPDVGRRARRSPPATRAARASTRCSTSCPGSWPAAPTSPATPAPSSRSAASSRPSIPGGRQIHFGIREHGMGGVMNGMAMHGGVLPVGGTFFIFSDYMRGAVRLAALSEAHVVYSWTHDSVGLGEDGPTHQPIEQLAVAAGDARPAR